MFGSLVFILPSPHAGGELVLKHGEDEYTFNAASTLKDLTNSIAYVAFYSDVDHEVREVTDGHRITVTYNLSWAKSGGNTPPASGGEPVLRPIADIQLDRSSFQSTLVSLLANPQFLPNGGMLGFALQHLYPLPTKIRFDIEVSPQLKGIDAILARTCSTIGIPYELRVTYVSKGWILLTKSLVYFDEFDEEDVFS